MPPQQYYPMSEDERFLRVETTYTENTSLGDGRVLLQNSLDVVRHQAGDLGRRVSSKELAEVLLLLVRVRRVPGIISQYLANPPLPLKPQPQNLPLNGAGLALEPVRDKDLVLVVGVAEGEDVGALQGLVKVSKDVVDDYDGLLGVERTGDVLSSTPC